MFITDKGEIIHITDTTVYDADSNEFLDEINERDTIDWYKNPLTRSENNYPQKITVTGFDREQAVGNYVKMSFGKESSIKYGIPQGTYLVSHRAIFKDLAQSEDESIKPRNYTTNLDDTAMGWVVSKYNSDKKLIKGFEVTSMPINGLVTASTLLRYIKCNLSGQSYSKYIPYEPSSLRWQYVLSYTPSWD